MLRTKRECVCAFETEKNCLQKLRKIGWKDAQMNKFVTSGAFPEKSKEFMTILLAKKGSRISTLLKLGILGFFGIFEYLFWPDGPAFLLY